MKRLWTSIALLLFFGVVEGQEFRSQLLEPGSWDKTTIIKCTATAGYESLSVMALRHRIKGTDMWEKQITVNGNVFLLRQKQGTLSLRNTENRLVFKTAPGQAQTYINDKVYLRFVKDKMNAPEVNYYDDDGELMVTGKLEDGFATLRRYDGEGETASYLLALCLQDLIVMARKKHNANYASMISNMGRAAGSY